ncbi:MAG: hypothetical protein NVSMB33_17200 [Ktedonobacteraceae bacterium]
MAEGRAIEFLAVVLPERHETVHVGDELTISAADDNSIDHAVKDFNAYNNSTKSKLFQVNTHGYNGSNRGELYQIGQQARKHLWMSGDTTNGTAGLGPLCIQTKQGATALDMFAALDLSCRIGRDLRLMHPQAWIYWQAVESSDDPGKAGCNSNKNA